MALRTGAHLGPYEIRSSLGAGGMGEVYLAHDSRLGRDVAVKVLPEHVAESAEALARFAREGRTAAGLSDPHICALHDVGVEDGVHYAVFELLEGETLRERLSRGALPPPKAVELTTQMCQGLAAAHAKGIVHRDIKPENLFLTRAGLKILDFGLAKLQPMGGVKEEGLSQEPTLSAQDQLTSPGTAPGTVAYMSPEQARGEAADMRSDIFATGVVLFEMLSGQRPFRKGTQVETLAAILNEDPPDLKAPSGPVAPGLERIVRRCLEKDPEDRFQSARDVTFALEAVSGTSGVADLQTGARQGVRKTPRWVFPALGVCAVTALLVGGLADRLWLRAPESAPGQGVVRSQLSLTPDAALSGPRNHPVRRELALSPDGTLLAWAGSPDGSLARSALYSRRLDTGDVTRLPGTEGASQPFFSPDGHWIGFAAMDSPLRARGLRKVPVEGGLTVDLTELSSWPVGAWWAPDGTIFLGSFDGGIQSVPAEGGPLREITAVDRSQESGHRLPSMLPDGRTLLVTTMPVAFGVKVRIEVVSLASGERKVVVEDGSDGRYLPTGHLVFVRQGTLMAAPFNLTRLELAAPPVPVVEGVSQALNLMGAFNNSGSAQFAVSASGLLVYGSGGIFEDTPVELLLVDASGDARPLPGFDRPLVYSDFRFSPDGRQLAFTENPRSGLLWLFDVERQTYRVLSDRGQASSPRWSPDGTHLLISWTDGGPFHLWVLPLDGGDRERLTEGEYHDWAPSPWRLDAQHLAFARWVQPSLDVLLLRFEDRQVVPFLTTQASESHPEVSPDGRWLAYASSESGRYEVYVTSLPDREQTLTVSREGGMAPAWSRDGRRLFYHSLQSADRIYTMMAVDVSHGPVLSLGQPTTLFRLPDGFVRLNPMRSYDLHPDGRRFLVGREAKTSPPLPITRLDLVHNWFAELERLAPTGRQ